MPKVRFKPVGVSLETPEGASLLETASSAGFGIEAPYGRERGAVPGEGRKPLPQRDQIPGKWALSLRKTCKYLLLGFLLKHT